MEKDAVLRDADLDKDRPLDALTSGVRGVHWLNAVFLQQVPCLDVPTPPHPSSKLMTDLVASRTPERTP